MPEQTNKFKPEGFVELLREFVRVDGESDSRIEPRIDVLERVLEHLRVHKHYLENRLGLEEFLQGDVFVDQGRLVYSPPQSLKPTGCGIHPVNLQPMLLVFLLIYHKESYRVYDIISKFIDKIWDQLSILDFKRTETGVIRCFTNTRFAARALRDFGLLKFTRKEAYKTWVLSLSGFLAASVLLREAGMDFRHADYEVACYSPVHPDIYNAYNNIRTYDMFVEELARLCEPNVEVFLTFEDVLHSAYSLLQDYWRVIQESSLSGKERKEISMQHIKQLEGLPEIDRFCSEFSRCVNVERLIGELEEPPSSF